MKIRTGFVSNSSSSSFIVIGNEELKIPKVNGQVLEVPNDFGGETEFGWGPDDLTDFGSRLNFAYLQAMYAKNDGVTIYTDKGREEIKYPEYLKMLEKVLKEDLKVSIIEWNISDGCEEIDEINNCKAWGYIDHQSCATEGRNLEMFDSEDELRKFLFAKDSKIHTDNDNH